MTPQQIADVFALLELELIRSLKQALLAGKKERAGWKLRRLQDVQAYRRRNQQIVADHLPQLEKQTAALLQEAYRAGVLDTAEQHREQADPTYILEGDFDGVDDRRLDALVQEVNENFRTVETAALRRVEDIYKKIAYQAQIAQATGAVTMEQAVDQAAKQFLERGIDCVQYADGRRVNIASYAEMALRTAATRSKCRGDAALRRQLGVDTVLVSQYGACSETCLPWQGRVYIDDVWGDPVEMGADGLAESRNGHRYMLLSVAVAEGLFHPNCRHSLSTWYEGISKPPPVLDAAAIRRTAALESRQRELERKVRKYKRLEAGALDPDNERKYRQKRLAAQKQLREFIAANDDVLRRNYWREKVRDTPDGISLKSHYKKLDPSSASPQNTQLTPDPKSTEIINRSIERFAKDFPTVDEMLQYQRYIYDTSDNPAITQLETNKQGKLTFGIAYNLNLWHNVTAVQEQVRREAATGGHTKTGEVASIAFHEFGHATMHTALLREIGYNGVFLGKQQERLYLALHKQLSCDVYEIAYPDFSGNYPELIEQIENDLSETACKEASEFIAECFAQYYCGKPCKAAKRIVHYFKRRLR